MTANTRSTGKTQIFKPFAVFGDALAGVAAAIGLALMARGGLVSAPVAYGVVGLVAAWIVGVLVLRFRDSRRAAK